MIILATIAAGGLGSVLRFWLGQVISAKSRTQIPFGIILINLLGSFGLGFFTHLQMMNPAVATIISTGFFGAFTTFSTFSVEAIQLLLDDNLKAAFIYVIISISSCMIAFLAGISLE